MTTASHELAITIINEGKNYDDRLKVARYVRATFAATCWTRIAVDGARAYEREFGALDDYGKVFTTEDILLCAVELAEYYAQHIKESDAAA